MSEIATAQGNALVYNKLDIEACKAARKKLKNRLNSQKFNRHNVIALPWLRKRDYIMSN